MTLFDAAGIWGFVGLLGALYRSRDHRWLDRNVGRNGPVSFGAFVVGSALLGPIMWLP